MKIALILLITLLSPLIHAKESKAIFAGGCFWCMEPPFEKLAGVSSVTSGYLNGHKKNPTYEEVSAGSTGHTEAVQIIFDPDKVSFTKLVDVFWHQIDPTTLNRSFVDRGTQYRSGIYYLSEEQKKIAEASKVELQKSGIFGKGKKIVTEIVKAEKFYPAEKYHQNYYKKNPIRYKFYRYNSGRDKYIEKTWGKAP
jgi:methionine-S-sulfoxide reductase